MSELHTNTDTDADKYILNGVEVTPNEVIETITIFLQKQQFRVGRLNTRIAELEEAQRWRVVADGELPEVYRDEDGKFIPFLVCENDKDYPYRAIYDGLNWGDGMFVADVTHWMPLPKLPEVQE